jgi:SWI/SNF-related matrix-associated actin-dependent regulator 1 of chromatin subfamily A
MNIVKEKTQYFAYAFEYTFSYQILEFCRGLKDRLGWRNFSFYDKKWRFNDVSVIDFILSHYPYVEVSDEVKIDYQSYKVKKSNELKTISVADEIKKKKVSSIVIPGTKGELYEYQKIGVEFFDNAGGRAILGDEPGTGKSVQSLAFVVYKNLSKTLVVCPSSVKYSWDSEVKKWTSLKSFVVVSSEVKDLATMDEAISQHEIIIINYDILGKFLPVLATTEWDCLIFDEFHFLKNGTSQRSKNSKLISKSAKNILLLSGTPFLNRPVELFNGLNLIDPVKWRNWKEYTTKYCNGHESRWGWDASGSSNVDELRQSISHYFLRRTKDEVLPELPEKRYIDVPIQLDKVKRFEYNLIMDSFREYLRDIKKKKDDEIARTMKAEALVKLNELRQITTMGKIDSAKELIDILVNNGEKVIVFSVYNYPLEVLHRQYEKNSVMLTGKSNEWERREAINNFQNFDQTKIFFGGLKAAGVGITLTAASNVIFLDYSWVPADHKQGEDRLHRPGTKATSIGIYQLYSLNTIDDYLRDILRTKQEVFDQIIEGKTIDSPPASLMNDLINRIENEQK